MTGIITFEDTSLEVTDAFGQPWLRGNQIGSALDLSFPGKAVPKIFRRHKGEFTADMTLVMGLETAGGLQKVRMFSPRGAALIALLANTPRAAAFRSWVLDTLERDGSPRALPAPASPVEPLLTAEARRVLRYRRLGLETREITRLIGRGSSTVKVITARLRAAGLLDATHA